MSSFWRNKNAPQIPPPPSEDNKRYPPADRSMNRSPNPPSYRSNASSGATYNASRDGDPYASRSSGPNRHNSNDDDPYAQAPSRQIPDRYRNIADPYARGGGNADADRAQLFAGYNPDKNKPKNRYDDRGEDEQPRTQEQEDEDIEGIKKDTRFMKQESVNSTRNALRIAREAEETARNTLLKLGDQSEKIANTERHLDMSKVHANRADDNTGELKQLNRSIFRPVISFNKEAKRQAQEEKIQRRHAEAREDRERAMGDIRDSQNRIGRAATYGRGDPDDGEGISGGSGRRNRSETEQKARLDARKRYQFEATASDDEMEDELDDNLDEIADVSRRLKALASAAGEEIDGHNDRLKKIATKVDTLDDKVQNNTRKLNKIK